MVWYDRSIYYGHIIWCDRSVRSIRGGFGHLKVSKKLKMKKRPSFETTVIVNYTPKFRLLFTILNVSTSTLILI